MFPLWKLPVGQSVSLMHPRDGRPVFATPWEGMALVGTTDLDHRDDPDVEPSITREETAYLVEALRHAFPRLDLRASDAVCSFSGVRPVVDDRAGGRDPSKAPREHVVRDEQGLITVTGGKLTTFRVNALDALRHAAPYLAATARSGVFATSVAAGEQPDDARRVERVGLRLPHGRSDLRAASLCRTTPSRCRTACAPACWAATARRPARCCASPRPPTCSAWPAPPRRGPSCSGRCATSRCASSTTCCCAARAWACCCPTAPRRCCRAWSRWRARRSGWSAGEWRDQRDRYVRIIAQCYTVPTP